MEARSVLLLAIVVAACSSRPTPVKRTLSDGSPGALAVSHETLDTPNRCLSCHAASGSIDANLCLGCHMKLATRIVAGRGFHASVRGKACESCHRDHAGRAFDLMGWQAIAGGMAGFDHDITEWKLQGNHRLVACERCHTTTNKQGLRTFLDAASLCSTCHEDQPHDLTPPRGECSRCHAEHGWKPLKAALAFDHDDPRDARSPRTSSHALVPCVACHPSNTFATGLPDPGACERCHAEKSPHGKRFDVLGKPTRCGTCHRASWRPSFAHPNHPKFPSQDHDGASCRACHRGSNPADFERLDARQATCGGCHAHVATVVHDGKYSNATCLDCHTTQHDPRPRPLLINAHGPHGTFPLKAGHKAVPCGDCHPGGQRPRFRAESPECSRCHQDAHRGSKGASCVGCHVSGLWRNR